MVSFNLAMIATMVGFLGGFCLGSEVKGWRGWVFLGLFELVVTILWLYGANSPS